MQIALPILGIGKRKERQSRLAAASSIHEANKNGQQRRWKRGEEAWVCQAVGTALHRPNNIVYCKFIYYQSAGEDHGWATVNIVYILYNGKYKKE
jgi:hypothetical protein